MSLARFFAAEIASDALAATLSESETHHLTRVLRLDVGSEVRVFDGKGREWRGRVSGKASAGATVELLGPVIPPAEPPTQVTLAIGLLKHDQMDGVIRDATMLGVSAILPVVSAHVSVPDRAWRSATIVERWQRIAISSAKQCGRAVVPTIASVSHVDEVLSRAPADVLIMCVEPSRGAGAVSLAAGPRPPSAFAMVGPEGGWSEGEIDQAVERGARLVHLGPRILRAETAPTVLLSALWTSWGW